MTLSPSWNYRTVMIKQTLLLLAAAALCSAHHGMYHPKKSAMTSPFRYGSVASFHSPRPSGPESERLQQQEAAPEAPPQLYAFAYQDEASSRQESGDASGRVTGCYHVVNGDGSVRLVYYVADENGFRADVDTSEPGTESANPADVTMNSRRYAYPGPAALQNAHIGCYKYKNGVKTFNAPAVDYHRQPMFNMGTANSGYPPVNNNGVETMGDTPARLVFLSSPVASKTHRQPAAFKAMSAPQLIAQQNSAGMYMHSNGNGNRVERVQAVPPSAYAFNYDAAAAGGSSSRSESADANGAVTGQYAVRNEDGSVRIVEYVADENGFRANVKTNEKGMTNDNPADVTMNSDAREIEFLPLQQHRPMQMAAQQVTPHMYNSRTNRFTQQKMGGWRR